jgi:ABC-type lipoprotein release transport system permease subunit
MSAVWLWVRSEWRRGWAGLVVLGLLIAAGGGVTLAVAAGARRADTALDRFMVATNRHQLEVEVDFPDDVDESARWARGLPSPDELADRLAAVPGVEGVTVMNWIGAGPEGVFPFNGAIGATRGRASSALLVEGRWADPTDPHEVVVGEAAPDFWGVGVGETLTLRTLAPDQWAEFGGVAEFETRGPTVDVRVVGVIRDVEEITDSPEPFLLATPAFLERYQGELISVPGVALVTADPDRLDEVATALQPAAGDSFTAGRLDEDFAGRIDESVSIEVTSLWVFAAIAAAAALIIVYQAVSRQMASLAHERTTRRALGVSRRDEVLGSVLRAAPAVIIGGLGAVGLAAALSPVFPRGLARRAEPAPGVLLDGPVLIAGALAILAVGLAIAVITAWSSRGRVVDHDGPVNAPLGRLARVLPPAAGLGVRFALGRSGRRIAVGWAGVVAVAIGVSGLMTVAAVVRSADHLRVTPRLFGSDIHAVVGVSPESDVDALVKRIAADPEVAAIGLRESLPGRPAITARGPSGETLVEPEVMRAVVGQLPGTVTAGRLPNGPGEVTIGDIVADRLGAEIGDTIELDGLGGPVRMVVVGRIITAGVDDLGAGLIVTHDGLDSLGADCPPGGEPAGCEISPDGIGVAFRPGTDVDRAIARLTEIHEHFRALPLPAVISNLSQIGSTPWLLAGFLALLGMGGLAHALVIGAGRRRRDLAVARALGFRPAQAAGAVRGQAIVLAAAGAAIGVLAGVVAGRLVWQRVAEGAGAVAETIIPAWAWVTAPLAALVVALLVSVVPSARAAALRPASVLRTE